nr:ABSCISIC ACID-INSENSITIVE 5-like protein 1 isoform X2 [Ziziphus jujuba var. spinosa]
MAVNVSNKTEHKKVRHRIKPNVKGGTGSYTLLFTLPPLLIPSLLSSLSFTPAQPDQLQLWRVYKFNPSLLSFEEAVKMEISESQGVGYGNIATNGNGNIKPESSPQDQPQEEDQPSKDGSLSSLHKQNSIFSLTFDEIRCKSGRSFGSMNMDEFLANIWSVEENEVPNSQLNQDEPPVEAAPHERKSNTDAAAAQPGSLARQGSFSIPIPLCKKTVDEVWFEIHKDQPPPLQEANNNFPCFGPQRQQTLGEMTLEDFLVKAGVVQESSNRASRNRTVTQTPNQQRCGNNMPNNNDACLDTQLGMGHHVMGSGSGSGYTNPQHGTAHCPGSSNGFGTYQMFGQSNILVGGTSNDAIEKCHSLTESGGLKNRKRIVDGPPEVVVERRQRRMIKNRESAARSRARKQTETEQKRKQEVLRRKQATMSTKAQKLADKLKTIRRTVSSAW